jgi:cytochrome c-type biogenesis protein CcmH
VRPLLSTNTANRAIHAARAEELQADVAAGRLAAGDHAAALRDLDRELAATLDGSHQEFNKASRTRGSHLTAGIVAALVVVAAGLLYWQLGNWRVAVEGLQAATLHHMDEMVAQLSQRLHTRDPGDLRGWAMLGQAYMLMGRYDQAEEAFDRARKLSSNPEPDLLASYAEAVALAEPDDFMQKAAPLFEQVLQRDPNNVRALWYGGLAALNRGDKNLAVRRWQLLLAQNLPADYQTMVRKSIEEAGGSGTPTAAPAAAYAINIHVVLDAKLRQQISPDETVYVYAEPSGPKAGPPLAVRRYKVKDLPVSITLSDEDAMVQGRSISNFADADITLVARISKTGNPIPQRGDPEGSAIWNRSDGHKVMTINIKS